MKIFPAIDIKDRKCVRLVKGDFDNKTEYKMSPVDQAGKYKDHGFKNLHVVDLDGALIFRAYFFLGLILLRQSLFLD